MTRIDVFQKSDGSYYRIKVHGHAGYAEHGEDIVCAAVSTLTINLINSLDELVGIKRNFQIDKDDALIDIILYDDELNEKVQLLMASYVIGVKSVEEVSHGFVKITIGG